MQKRIKSLVFSPFSVPGGETVREELLFAQPNKYENNSRFFAMAISQETASHYDTLDHIETAFES
jgi:hypothetical protein